MGGRMQLVRDPGLRVEGIGPVVPQHRLHRARALGRLNLRQHGGRDYVRGHVPQPNCLVIAATGQGPAIRGERYRTDPIAVPLQDGRGLSGSDIPKANGIVRTATGHDSAIQRRCHRKDFALVLQDIQQLSRADIPEPDRPVRTANLELPHVQGAARAQVPQQNQARCTPASYSRAIRRVRYRYYFSPPPFRCLQDRLDMARIRIPEPNRPGSSFYAGKNAAIG